jgi:hypothetical protein
MSLAVTWRQQAAKSAEEIVDRSIHFSDRQPSGLQAAALTRKSRTAAGLLCNRRAGSRDEPMERDMPIVKN